MFFRKKRVCFSKVLIFFAFLSLIEAKLSASSFSSTLERDVVFFFQNTKNFHSGVVSLLGSETFFYPSHYTIILRNMKDDTIIRHHFDINFFSEDFPSDDSLITTVPYYSFLSSDGNFRLFFCLSFPMEEASNIILVNDAVMKIYLNGRVDELAQSSGFIKKSAFFHPRYKLDKTVIWETLFIIVLVISNILLVVYCSYLNKKNQIAPVKVSDSESRRYREIAREKTEEVKREITDSVTRLFNGDFIRARIQKEIVKSQYSNSKFCVAFFIVQDTGNYIELRKIAGIITENLNRNIFSAYLGNGVFLSFFPGKSEEEISIFVDLTVEKIYDSNIAVVSRIHEYDGQEDFLTFLNI